MLHVGKGVLHQKLERHRFPIPQAARMSERLRRNIANDNSCQMYIVGPPELD